MKKISLFIIVSCAIIVNSVAQWQPLDRKKAGGGEIPLYVSFMQLDNNKLYAATSDGIWESASKNGGDWVPFGLQGQDVRIMNFKELKLAMTTTTSSENAQEKAGQLYKLNGGKWELTSFNSARKTCFLPTSGFVQIKDDEGKLVILIPTWQQKGEAGQGIWRSEDGGTTWTKCPYVEDPDAYPNPNLEIGERCVGLFSYDNDPVVYGTEKAGRYDNYLIRSYDYGKTWTFDRFGNIFNPWAFHKRKYNGADTYYIGGECGQLGYQVLRSRDTGPDIPIIAWKSCMSVDNTAAGMYWQNRCMVGKDEGPLFAMCSGQNVYMYDDKERTMIPFPPFDDETVPNKYRIKISSTTNAFGSAVSLTHMVLTDDDKLYCSGLFDGIQVIDVNKVLGIKGTKYAQGSIYPSIANDYIFVDAADADTEIIIFSVSGMLVAKQPASGVKSEINITGLDAGLYIVKYTSSGILSTGKFIKK